MHAYLGITCHFVTKEWEVLSLLISCSQLHGRHTGENILSEFEEVVSRAGISLKVYRVVTDNASNVRKAFESLPGFDIEKDSDDEDDQMEESEDSDVDVMQLDSSEGTVFCSYSTARHQRWTEIMPVHIFNCGQSIPNSESCPKVNHCYRKKWKLYMEKPSLPRMKQGGIPS